MTAFEHLHPDIRYVMACPPAERIELARRDKWIPHQEAQGILDRLDQLVAFPRSTRMPSLLILGRPNNGKSSVLQQFARRHPVLISDTGNAVAPVLLVEMPAHPTETELWSAILGGMGISFKEKEVAHVKKRQVKSLLRNLCTKVLAIDEFNNLIYAGKLTAMILAEIKELSNELQISIAAAGTQSALNAIHTEPQMKTRFEEMVLPKWKTYQEYRSFVATYEEFLPLAHFSDLAGEKLFPIIYEMAGDTVGDVTNLLKKAAETAILSGKERITPELLKSMKWRRPGDKDEVAKLI